VDGITNDLNPNSYTFPVDGQNVSMHKYFLQKFRINLIPDQPLLYVNKRNDRIYLPTEVCH
jgi:hypothetical protein